MLEIAKYIEVIFAIQLDHLFKIVSEDNIANIITGRGPRGGGDHFRISVGSINGYFT